MALIKNAYTPGQWYTFFYDSKNVEQSSYYNDVEKCFSSWYSFLQKDQIQGKIFDFLGVPNYCGKIEKKHLHKIYVNENSRNSRFKKLDVQVKKIQLNDTHQSSTKSFKFFKSKNALNTSDKNTKLHDSVTRTEQQKVDDRRTNPGTNSFSKNESKSKSQVQLKFSEQTNGFNSGDSSKTYDDVQVKRTQLNHTHQPCTESLNFFKSKNALNRSDKNTKVDNSITRIEQQKVDERRAIAGKSSISKNGSKLKSQRQLDFSERTSGNDGDDSCNKADDVLSQSDEDMFVEFSSPKRSFKEPTTVIVSETPVSYEKKRGLSDRTDPRCTGDTGQSKIREAQSANRPEKMCLKQPSSFSTSKKKVEFKNEDEYFFFKEINSSTTHSSDSDVAAEPKSADQASFMPAEFSEFSSNDDDNAFDTGFLSPVQDFCSASPLQSQEILSPHEPATTGASNNVCTGSTSATEGNFSSNDDGNAFDTGFLSPGQVMDFCSENSLQSQRIEGLHEPATAGASNNICTSAIERDVSSNDDDNVLNTGFSSPFPDLCSASPPQPHGIVIPQEQGSTGVSVTNSNVSSLAVERDDNSNDDDNDFDTKDMSLVPDFCSASLLQQRGIVGPHEPITPRIGNAHKPENTSSGNSHATARGSAATRSMVLSHSLPKRDFPVDRTISRALSVKSTDDEMFSQTSAMTEVFTASIMVDLRIPGALQNINDEYKRMFDTLSSQNPFLGSMRGPSNVFDIANLDNSPSLGNNRTQVINSDIGDSRKNLINGNTIYRGRKNLTQDSITINSQEELTEIRRLNLNFIENDSVMRCSEQNLDDEMSKIVERVNVSSDPVEIRVGCDIESPQILNSDAQHDSMQVNPSSLQNTDKSVADFNNETNRNEKNSKNENAKKLRRASPTPMIVKPATPLGKNSLPLKKRSLFATPKSTSRGFHKGNAAVARTQRLTGIDVAVTNEAYLPATCKSVEKVRFNDTVESIVTEQNRPPALQLQTYNYRNSDAKNEIEEIAVERSKTVIRDDFLVMNPDMMKTNNHDVDLAWKLSLPHISELFFNDPDVSTKFREGSLSCSASRGTSSKSTHPRKHINEEPRADSNLNSSIAHEFEDLDLNPQEQKIGGDGISSVKCEVWSEDAVTPKSSVMARNDFTGSPSPQSENHSESDIANSPFFKEFLVHTQSFLMTEKARVSDIYEMETPGKPALESSKSDNDNVSPLLKNYKRESPKQISSVLDTDFRSVKSSVLTSDTNFQEGSVKSTRLSVASRQSSIIAQWWNNENRTPMRKYLSENNSSGSDDSLRVLPSTSQRRVMGMQRPPIQPAENVVHRDFSISSRISETVTRNSETVTRNSDLTDEGLNRPKDKANFENLAGAKSSEKISESGETVHARPADGVPFEQTAKGKRMSFVFSNVITKPVGSERQSNDHDFLIYEDEDLTTLFLLQEE